MTIGAVAPVNDSMIETILNYWFADIGDGFDIGQQQTRWYGGSEDLDNEIRAQFAPWLQKAKAGLLTDWTVTAQGTLALVLLLDQFSRNIHRGEGEAFVGDEQALVIVKAGIEDGVDRQLSWVQRSFFYMPFEHSEQLSDQDRVVALFEQLLQQAPDAGAKYLQSCLSFARHHREIIQQFGRFPHRNASLQRESTAQELAYLTDGGARFGQ
jgi:uncharacterized protein (DUF924 family)